MIAAKPAQADLLRSVEDTMVALSISHATLMRWIRSGKLPAERVHANKRGFSKAGRWGIRQSTIDAEMERRRSIEEQDMLRLAEVEVELKVARITLLRWIKNGKMQAVRVGRDWRVKRSVVNEIKES